MINRTKIKVSKKHEKTIELLEKDDDGYWLYTNPGFCIGTMGEACHASRTDTMSDMRRDIQSIADCDCENCKKGYISYDIPEMNRKDI